MAVMWAFLYDDEAVARAAALVVIFSLSQGHVPSLSEKQLSLSENLFTKFWKTLF